MHLPPLVVALVTLQWHIAITAGGSCVLTDYFMTGIPEWCLCNIPKVTLVPRGDAWVTMKVALLKDLLQESVDRAASRGRKIDNDTQIHIQGNNRWLVAMCNVQTLARTAAREVRYLDGMLG
ncbi:hypothetical protein F5J12DRAFT_317978 [Pisolithus orientalis]|uniref:uncharacterized protein n=1 Tax=Pisolithus orientalis TaxID=936130 RepID=UPI002224A88F|nr:uncharacterized protein F5J12DRAFT_317978 [Pisolithus orientalis]KAI5998498.1 hypothetical protein F5J12DRAFT_317978 [Pisolithus orientalis]